MNSAAEFGAAARWRRAFAMLAANAVWINASEIWRYFAVVMPMMRGAFPAELNVAPMNIGVFALWGFWDTILVAATSGFFWMYFEHFGASIRNALVAAALFWAAVFVILWLALLNMNLAPLRIAARALPLALMEMTVSALIILWGSRRFTRIKVELI